MVKAIKADSNVSSCLNQPQTFGFRTPVPGNFHASVIPYNNKDWKFWVGFVILRLSLEESEVNVSEKISKGNQKNRANKEKRGGRDHG